MPKVILPRIPAGLREVVDESSAFVRDASFEHLIIRGFEAINIDAPKMQFDETALDRLVLINAAFDDISMLDTEVRGCDLSAARLSSGSFNRVRFTNCRMTGVDFSRSALKHVTFTGCKLDIANFRFAKLAHVTFEDCTLIETDFQVGELADVAFSASTLERVMFDQCKLRQVDARGSLLSEIHGWRHLRGLTIDNTQLITIAPELASELGLSIKD